MEFLKYFPLLRANNDTTTDNYIFGYFKFTYLIIYSELQKEMTKE